MDSYLNLSLPDFLVAAAQTPAMLRLKEVGMNCGCEYTSFPRFVNLPPYSRWQHSVCVGAIVWHFTLEPRQALAGLLHDIATPTFAHVIDFLHGDAMTQESTEAGTQEIIEDSQELQGILADLGFKTEDVCDYHLYPIADNPSPQLSADRLEYTLSNLVNYGFRAPADCRRYFDDLLVDTNEHGEVELVFQTHEIALGFASGALQCSRVYISDEDRYAMQALADLLRTAVHDRIIDEHDFYGTEGRLIQKLLRDSKYARQWAAYRALHALVISGEPQNGPGWINVSAKKRTIDPFVKGSGRVSELYPDYANSLSDFQMASQNYWMSGE